MKLKSILFCLAICIALSNCSVQKRHYRKGFHVEWLAEKSNTAPKIKNKPSSAAPQVFEKSLATAPKEMLSAIVVQPQSTAAEKPQVSQANTTSKKSSRSFTAKPMQPLAISQAFTISKKQELKANDLFDEKSQIVALILCLLVGVLGIHRFYLGYYGIGLLQLFTLGGCGIWTLIDLILIITGDLTPKDDDYDETF